MYSHISSYCYAQAYSQLHYRCIQFLYRGPMPTAGHTTDAFSSSTMVTSTCMRPHALEIMPSSKCRRPNRRRNMESSSRAPNGVSTNGVSYVPSCTVSKIWHIICHNFTLGRRQLSFNALVWGEPLNS